MKKIIILLMASLFIIAACSNGNKKPEDSENTNVSTDTGGTETDVGNNTTVDTPVYIGTKAPTEPKAVGDIVFNDGSATPYTSGLTLTDSQKASAIAIIFYKGTGLNSDIYKGADEDGNAVWDTGDTTTSRTLGIGLKHESQAAWCPYGDGVLNITTIQCTANGNAGNMSFIGDRNGSDNFEQIAAFEYVEDTETEEYYPAFYFAKNYKEQKIGDETESRIVSGSEYENGWYLPSIAELFEIYKSRQTLINGVNLDTVIECCGGDNFPGYFYWSSSQFYSDDGYSFYAYRCNVDSGKCGKWDKNKAAGSVCVVREFN